MPRPRYSLVSSADTYHVYSRGVNKSPLFLDLRDYQRFTFRLHQYAAEERVVVRCSCLKGNHFHLLISMAEYRAMSHFLHRLLTAYSMYFNKKYAHTGHVFESRFFSKPVESEAYYQQLIKYIANNAAGDPFPWLLISDQA